MYGIVIVEMNSSKDSLQAGIVIPVIILLATLVIGISVAGFVIFKKNSQPTVPTESSQPIESPSQPETTKAPTPKASPVEVTAPFVGIWKVDKHYIFEQTSKTWVENQAVIDESQRYLRFTQEGTLCKGTPSTQGFICADKEEAYQVSGDLILLPNVPSSRIRWSMIEGRLELIYELPVQSQLEPTIKYILLPQ